MKNLKELLLKNTTVVPAGINISIAIKEILKEFTDITKIRIEKTDNIIPYTIQKIKGESVDDLLKTINNLYSGFVMFINEEGTFVFQSNKELKDTKIECTFV